MSLIEIYNRINSPKDTNVYNTDKISNHHNHLIGINSKKQVAIIFDACEPSGSNDNLTNISLQHNLSCGIYDKLNKRIDKKVSIILCKSDDEKVKRLFLKSLEGTVLGLQSIISQKEITEINKMYYDNNDFEAIKMINIKIENLAKKNKILFLSKQEFLCDNDKNSCFAMTENGKKIFMMETIIL